MFRHNLVFREDLLVSELYPHYLRGVLSKLFFEDLFLKYTKFTIFPMLLYPKKWLVIVSCDILQKILETCVFWIRNNYSKVCLKTELAKVIIPSNILETLFENLLWYILDNLLEQNQLTFSWRKFLSYRNQSIDLLCKSMDCFLYDKDLHHERVKESGN